MKKLSLILLCCGGMSLFNNLGAQSAYTPPPSDAVTGFTYDFDSAKKLIIERQTNPKKDNIDVQPIIDSKDFPKLINGNNSNEAYNVKLNSWMEKNSNIIIETLKSRKEIVQHF